MKGESAGSQAHIDAEGRLILEQPNDPGLNLAMRRKEEFGVRPPASPQKPPQGEWRFAYIRKSSINAGPPFDAITFNGGKAQLEFTPAQQRFEVACRLANNALSFATSDPPILSKLMNYTPLGFPLPKNIQFAYRWENEGQTLILSNAQASPMFACEWAFLRPEQFQPNKLAGTWIGKGSLTGAMMEVRQDGTLNTPMPGEPPPAPGAKPRLPVKYYRLWKSPFGDAISIVQLSPDMQLAHVQMARLEVSGEDIILTPLECKYGETLQLAQAGRANWKLASVGTGLASHPMQAAVTTAPTTSTITPVDLAGNWTGNAEGTRIDYAFNPDGTALWQVGEPNFKEQFPSGLKCRYAISRGSRFDQLDLSHFANSEMEGMRFRAIFVLINENTLKMEGRPSSEGLRPQEFSIEAVTFKRQGPKPKFDAATLVKIRAASAVTTQTPYKIAALPRDVITLPGGVKLEMVRISAGGFQMGQPGTPDDPSSEAQPVHPVTIKDDFALGRTEVTQAQWIAIMGAWPADANENDPLGRKISPILAGPNYPAYGVSWDDCQRFVGALNAYVTRSDQGPATFRLPSEAEWEYACRAGTQTHFYWGDDPSLTQIEHYAWYGDNAEANGMEYAVHEVGLKLPNPWGLFDMSGNVSEWCQDLGHYNYKGGMRPDDGRPWMDGKSTDHVMRGGGVDNMARALYSAWRQSVPNYRNRIFGMRLARDTDKK